MPPTIFTVRVDAGVKKRLERLANNTGRSRSSLAVEAINRYLDINEWQLTGIKRAIASLDRGEGFAHDVVKDWVASLLGQWRAFGRPIFVVHDLPASNWSTEAPDQGRYAHPNTELSIG